MKRTAVILSVTLLLAAGGMAQVTRTPVGTGRTVTNADLERHKQKRLTAERDYRENYAQLGFPSPEELEMQMENSRIEREELSAKLREERLERERINADRAIADAEAATAYYNSQSNEGAGYRPFYGYSGYGGYGGYGSFGGGFGFGNSGFGRFGHRGRIQSGGVRFISIPGYRATPAGVFSSPVRVPIFTSRPGRRLR